MKIQTSKTAEQMRADHEARMSEPEVLSIAYHRICGDGFYVALVRAPEADQRVLVVIVPGWAVEGEPCPSGFAPGYAIDPALAAGPWTKPGTIAFGANSWRGDHYYDLVAAAAREYEASR